MYDAIASWYVSFIYTTPSLTNLYAIIVDIYWDNLAAPVTRGPIAIPTSVGTPVLA